MYYHDTITKLASNISLKICKQVQNQTQYNIRMPICKQWWVT